MEAVNSCPDSETLSMHAFGLLQSYEHDHVELHLHVCAKCRTKAASLAETLGVLALQVPLETPPPSLKAKVMTQVDQLARETKPTRPIRRWSLWSAAAVAAVLALTLGIGSYRNGSGPHQAIQQAVVDAKRQGAHVVALEGTKDAPRARGELFVVSSTGPTRRVVVSVEGLSEPAGTQVYCLWLIKDGQRSVGGWLSLDKRGRGGLVFETTQSFDTVGVTLEPDPDYFSGQGGGVTPRGPKVLGAPRI